MIRASRGFEAQPPSAETAGLILKRRGGRRPAALVDVGPLSPGGYERVEDLVDTTDRTRIVRDPRNLPTGRLATADEPFGF